MLGFGDKKAKGAPGKEPAPVAPIIPDVAVEEAPAPETIPAPAPHHEFTEAHGYPSLRRVQPPQE